jgi:hypothetical protein
LANARNLYIILVTNLPLSKIITTSPGTFLLGKVNVPQSSKYSPPVPLYPAPADRAVGMGDDI